MYKLNEYYIKAQLFHCPSNCKAAYVPRLIVPPLLIFRHYYRFPRRICHHENTNQEWFIKWNAAFYALCEIVMALKIRWTMPAIFLSSLLLRTFKTI